MKYKDLLLSLQEAGEKNRGVTFIESRQSEKFISYTELFRKSTYIARLLRERGAKKGTEVMLRCKNTEQYMYAFWACIAGGFIGIPLENGRSQAKTDNNNHIRKKLNDPYLLYDVKTDSIAQELGSNRAINVMDVDSVPEKFDYEAELSEPEDIVYVQFSSGSTGVPKGVIERKKNLSFSIQQAIEHIQISENDSILSWQPLTHCFGLVSFHMVAIQAGINQYIIPTEVFINDPIIWLEKANEHRITRLGSIPFALRHFLNIYKKSTQQYTWDLTCVKSISIGGEQVSIETIDEFLDIMESTGLSKETIGPSYGLAEATTLTTTKILAGRPKAYCIHNKELTIGGKVDCVELFENRNGCYASVGSVIPGGKVEIRDDEDRILPPFVFGHIFLQGDFIATGYYKEADTEQRVFMEGQYLDTGDLGFIANGELVVVGRKKELVISSGKKYACISVEKQVYKCFPEKVLDCTVVTNAKPKSAENDGVAVFIKTSLNLRNPADIEKFLEYTLKIKDAVYEVFELVVDYVVPVEEIPKTSSGKIRRRYLAEQFKEGEFDSIMKQISDVQEQQNEIEKKQNVNMARDQILEVVVNLFNKMFQIQATDFDLAFKDYGIVSVNIPPFIEELNKELGVNVSVSAIFNYPSINQFVNYLYGLKMSKSESGEKIEGGNEMSDNKVAIVGMSCRLPGGANDVDKLWEVLISGKDGIVDIPEVRWNLEKFYDEDEEAPGKMYVKKAGFLDVPIDEFDAGLFNISPKEAMAMDPQQRLLLELTWEAFENGSMDITKYNGSDTGVYLGISCNEYTMSNLYSHDLSNIDAYSLTGTAFSVACGRVSYTFGFEGPCFSVDTACSSGLTALHLACNAIKEGDTSLAVVAGVNLILSPVNCVGFSKLHATSVDGHSKSFDASANGYGRGEGGGVLLLKRLKDAERDGDNILGVICATGINQDGKSNGLTAPNGVSQAGLIRKTLKKAHLEPQDIDYMEMHGTGTKLGDPIEVNAVAETYGDRRSMDNPLRIGSIKSNIGHLEPASGMASIIKVILSMKNNLIPADLHFNTPNPLIDWDNIPVRVVDKHYPWEKPGKIRRAAISGFGFGGSNAHVIMEEYMAEKPVEEEKKEGLSYVFKLSAKSEKSLKSYAKEYVEYFGKCDEKDFADAIYTADRGRADLEYRLAVTGKDKKDILTKLETFVEEPDTEDVFCNLGDKDVMKKDKKVVFMFTGQGSQYVNMGRMLYESNQTFRSAMETCDRLFKPLLLKSIIDLVYGEKADAEVIAQTIYAQPLIFAIEYSLCKMWEEMGVKPSAVMGHSIGEYAAAVTAGIMSLEDAVKLVSIRGRLMHSAPGSGSMATIFASEDVVTELIEEYKDTVSIAARNAKETCAVSGNTEHIKAIVEKAQERGIRAKELVVSHAFHSVLMEPILDDFRDIAKEVEYKEAKVTFLSCLYARALKNGEVLDAEYWTTHIREKVDFYKTISSLENEGYVFLEVGSNRVLSALCKLIFSEDKVALGSLNIKKEDSVQVAETIAQLYTAGINIDWLNVKFFGRNAWNKVAVPNYPYDKQRYWKDVCYVNESGSPAVVSEGDVHKLLGEKIESPMMEGAIIFQRKFTGANPYFMGEHIIFDTPISPAAAHISMLLSAVKEVKNPASCTLKDMELRVPLAVYEDEERTVQICLSELANGNLKFQIVSKSEQSGDDSWLIHTQGEIEVHDEYKFLEDKGDIEDFKNRKPDEVVPEDGVYLMMKTSGFGLGDGFRRIMKSSCSDGESICFIQPDKEVPDLDMYELYPGIIDSVLQTQLCALVPELNKKQNGKNTVIPYYLGAVTYNFRQSGDLWVHGKSNVRDGVVYSELTAYNEEGETVIKMSNTMANLTNRNDLLREIKNNYNNMYYHVDWVEEASTGYTDLSTKYVVVSDKEATALEIQKGLQDSSADASITVFEGTTDVFDALCEDIKNSGSTKKMILYNCGMDTSYEDGIKADTSSLEGLTYLVVALNNAGLSDKVKVKIVTKNVQLTEKEEHVNVNQAVLWGFAKVFSIEHAGLYAGIVDVSDGMLGDEAFITELMKEDSNEVVLKGGKRYVSKLLKHKVFIKKDKEVLPAIEVKEDASYLVTGGTGALGMIYIDQLVNMGAKNLILMSRKAPKDEVKAKLDEFANEGVTVKLLFADVCDQKSIETGLQELLKEMPPVKGVIHAAGIINDKMIIDSDWADYEAVLSAKVFGLTNIYNALDKSQIDFFVMLSSITSIIGNMGQSNYAAANYYMNKLAEQMQKENINAYAMCWGPWQAGGMAVGSSAIDQNLDMMGLRAFTPEVGARIIEQFFARPFANTVIADVSWDKLGANLSGDWQGKFLSEILVEDVKETKETKEENSSIITKLEAMDADERKEHLLNVLQLRCGKIMGFENQQLPKIDVGLREQGADSLMIFSMRTAVNKMLGTSIDVSTFFNYPTLDELTDHLLNDILFVKEEKEEETVESAEDILDEISKLID